MEPSRSLEGLQAGTRPHTPDPGRSRGTEQFRYEVFLQRTYKNDTKLGGDSDVDVVIRLAHKLDPNVVDLVGAELHKNDAHEAALRQWQPFRRSALRAVRSPFGDDSLSRRKNLKIRKDTLPADAAPSYSMECLPYNVLDRLFKSKPTPTCTGILGWLKTAKIGDFQCQNEKVALFRRGHEQWSAKKARMFVGALQGLWDAGG